MSKSQTPSNHHPKGWHSRGYLPQFDAGDEYPQFVTFRLAGSLPKHVIDGWKVELEQCRESQRERELHRLIEAHLDSGTGECYLRDPSIAQLVETALLHFDSVRYHLLAWVIMPNHVHVAFTPTSDWSLSNIVGSWKSYTAKSANQRLGRTGQFWHEDYFDRYIRNDRHLFQVMEYVELNPVKAGLCKRPELWPFGSARLRKEAELAAETAAVQG